MSIITLSLPLINANAETIISINGTESNMSQARQHELASEI
jgi:hypothetical protein